MDDITLEFASKEFESNKEILGRVTVGFPGRYDGIVINSQILDSNELITFKSYNGRKISHNVARLFVARDAMPENSVEFTSVFEFATRRELEVKFRASIIEQHKEVESAVVFGRLLAS